MSNFVKVGNEAVHIGFRGAMTQEYEQSLRHAFSDHHADCIVITSRREQFQMEAANYGIAQGWLTGEWDTRDEQSTAWICRLTQAGRAHFQ